jgi:hypothetical protein
MSKRSIAVLAGAVALAFLSGCGGGDDEEALTRAQFIKQGDAVCTEANERSAKLYNAFLKENATSSGPKKSFEEEGIEVGEKVIVPNAELQAAGLAELPPPEGEEEKVDAIVGAIEAGLTKVKANPSSFYGKSYPFEEANRLMSEYGFEVCGKATKA